MMSINVYTNPIKIDFLYIHVDGNGTAVIGDTTKKINTLIGEIAGAIEHEWALNQPKMSYKEYVQTILHPGNKYDTSIKALQEEKINTFITDLKETNHPLYEKAFTLYTDLEKTYLDQETQQVKFTIFPSVLHLIDKVKDNCLFSVTLRTFGFDGDVVGKEFSKCGVEMTRRADMINGDVKFEGESEITTGPHVLTNLQKANTIGQDQVKAWFANGRQAGYSKLIPCVEDALFEGKVVVALFLDDNFKKQPKKTDQQIKPADPKEVNIGYPKDIYGRATSWDSKGIIGIKVNTIKAALNKDYLVNKVNKQLAKRGFAILV